MKLHYQGTYNLDPNTLPQSGHRPGAVPFKEAKDSKALGIIANGLCLAIIIVLAVPVIIRCRGSFDQNQMIAACVMPIAALLPHELLHALCFRGDVYLYTNLRQGMLFVVGAEDMSKARFVFMSLLPNLVFGFIPFIIGMLLPNLALAFFGTLCIGMGGGDYYNVFNALTQVPNGAKVYNYQFNSYWYLPQKT